MFNQGIRDYANKVAPYVGVTLASIPLFGETLPGMVANPIATGLAVGGAEGGSRIGGLIGRVIGERRIPSRHLTSDGIPVMRGSNELAGKRVGEFLGGLLGGGLGYAGGLK